MKKLQLKPGKMYRFNVDTRFSVNLRFLYTENVKGKDPLHFFSDNVNCEKSFTTSELKYYFQDEDFNDVETGNDSYKYFISYSGIEKTSNERIFGRCTFTIDQDILNSDVQLSGVTAIEIELLKKNINLKDIIVTNIIPVI